MEAGQTRVQAGYSLMRPSDSIRKDACECRRERPGTGAQHRPMFKPCKTTRLWRNYRNCKSEQMTALSATRGPHVRRAR
jgi:hypothetical protein